jgi:hypothetical protein
MMEVSLLVGITVVVVVGQAPRVPIALPELEEEERVRLMLLMEVTLLTPLVAM